MKFSKSTILSVLATAVTTTAVAAVPLVVNERLLSFEESDVPSYVVADGGFTSITGSHYKDGSRSLLWNYTPGAVLSINRPVPFEPKDPTGADTYLSTFVVWVHADKPCRDGHLTFQFVKDGKVCSWFDFGLDFTGWRAAYVCFERDMQGTPAVGMTEIRVIAPDAAGTIALDHVLTAAKMDHRYQTADLQVPFVNAETTSHWLQLLNHSRRTPDIPAEDMVTPEQKAGIALIEQRFRDLIYQPSELSDKRMDKLRGDYAFYGIKRNNDGSISGLPIFFERAGECYERILPGYIKPIFSKAHMEMKEYFNLMNRIAIAYNDAQSDSLKSELADMFLMMYDHIADQGVGYGSCMGDFTHYGYSFRGYYTAYFLMKDVLRNAGRLADAEKGMRWYAMTNEVFAAPDKWGMDIDTFNTGTTGRIASILMMDDTPEKVVYLKSFSRWIDNGCLPAQGLSGCFKTDGACFHHCNNYPAYAIGGLDGASNMIYLLSRTPFAVSRLAHSTVKNVLQTMRFYCNKEDFPLSMSGRHPDGKGHLIPVQYGRMAIAGTPDGDAEIDPEMAGAFLRLVIKPGDTGAEAPEYVPAAASATVRKIAGELAAKGYKPENAPTGNKNLGYGCVNIHRRANWSAVARGHSRYLWAAEHYRGENLYGRYLAHGSLQIFTSSDGSDNADMRSSGWQEAGFDWARIPGATAMYLPIDSLKAKVLNVDKFSGFEEMLFSDEAFAGGISHRGANGAFGMKLHEHDKYNGSMRARKSYHFLGDKIICLGSNIECADTTHNVETTVFQLALFGTPQAEYWQTPLGGNKWLIDHLGTGYYIPDESFAPQVHMAQKSISNEGKPTEGDWVSLTINHGSAPRGACYHYAIVPRTDAAAMADFAGKQPYTVLQHDGNAHIVADTESAITSYVLFEPGVALPKHGIVKSTDTPCLIMVTAPDKNNAIISVANPDLALYSGAPDEIYDADGKRIERSIYSRPWKDAPSQTAPVRVTLHGKWQIPANTPCAIVDANNKSTTLEFPCKDAAPIEVSLVKD